MTVEEKARDLMDSIEGVLGNSVPTGDDPYYKETKQIVIILCDYIIGEILCIIGSEKNMWREGEKEQYDHWQCIKQYILDNY